MHAVSYVIASLALALQLAFYIKKKNPSFGFTSTGMNIILLQEMSLCCAVKRKL